MKILLAEDDPNIATIAKMTLSQLGGHEVDHAVNGEEALILANKNKYDIILLDEMMPKMNGLKVAQELFKSGNKAPVIFMSAKASDDNDDEFAKYSIGFIAKPFDPSKLSETITSIIEQENLKNVS